jgi:hypothetical protein
MYCLFARQQIIHHDIDPWDKSAERRHFFEDYAKENGFDPLIPDNWYSQSRDKIMSTKVVQLEFYFITSPLA